MVKERLTNCLIVPCLTKGANFYSELTLYTFPWWLATTKDKTIIEKKIDELHEEGYKTVYIFIKDHNSRWILMNILTHNGVQGYKIISDMDGVGKDLEDCDIIDLGNGYPDEEEYKRELVKKATKNTSRYFNSLEFNKATVVKKALTEQAIDLQESELNFYRMWSDKIPSMCKLVDYSKSRHEMVIEKVNGMTAQDWYQKNPTKYIDIISKVKSALEEFNKVEIPSHLLYDSEEDIKNAFKNELIDKIEERVDPIMPMISKFIYDINYGNKPFYIDGMEVENNFNYLLGGIKEWYEDEEKNFNGCICHGDPNTDNTMIDEDGNVKFIDPRGYFGKLKTCGLGLPEYDLAKFCYGLNGYSVFNSAPYITISVDYGRNITVNYPTCDGSITRVDLDDMSIDNNIKIIIGIIWMKLSSYIINDPMKSVIAYLYGNAICTKYLTQEGYLIQSLTRY